MKKGMFVNYQMAEAINMLNEYNNANPKKIETPEMELERMKKEWSERLIPGYGVPIGNAFAGMQDITIEDVKTFAEDIMQVDTYSTENAANMQYCLIKDAEGKIDFDFTALRHIAELAKANGKKLVIDSAVVFGDRYPENMKDMTPDEVRDAIAIYIQKLTQEFGDVIERIDVLNSVFQREDVLDKTGKKTSEQFWIDTFVDKDYASEVLDIARENCVKSDIKLCWNEFYLTHQGMPKKQETFIEIIKSLKGKLDVIGVQDNFRADVNPEYIEASLKTLVKESKELGIEISITELGCGVGKRDIESLNEVRGTAEYLDRLNKLNDRTAKILDMVINFAKENGITVETRHSNKYDWNSKYGHEGIQTGLSRKQLKNLLEGERKQEQVEDTRQKIEEVVMNLAANVPNIPKETVQKVITSLVAMKQPKDVIEKLAMSLEKVFGNSPQFKDIYVDSLEQILTIDATAFENVEELLKKVEFNKTHNITPGNISISENHALIDSTISSLCSKLNELGVDYYLVGALSAFIGTGVPLFRYHGDLDFMIAEKDIDKVREALKDSDYVFEDNRMTTDKTYDPKVGHTQGEHEVIANHKENEFHLGFFLFDRYRDGSIDINEYYKGRKDGKDVPMVLKRHLPKELVELEYTTESIEYASTTFRTSTPESIYAKKSYTAKGKDLLDIEALEGSVDFDKIEKAKKIRTTTRTMRADDRSFNH